MKAKPHTRKVYQQVERAAATEENRKRIIESAVNLIQSSRRINEISLAAIAEDAGVALRTVLRHFGSREGVFHAAFAQIRDTFSGDRKHTEPGDVDAAIAGLLEHYERDGDLNIKALEEENDLPLLHELLEIGRTFHQEWIEEVFSPLLPRSGAARERKILTLYAATDVYLWKLLRRDLRKSAESTRKVFSELVRGAIGEQ